MSSDSISNGSVTALSRDFGKKKRANRSAKLKQCKLDARREQWLSQVKSNKGFKDESNVGGGSSPPSSLHPIDERGQRSSKNLETRSRGEENDGSSLHDSDLEFLTSSPNNNSRKGCFGSGSGSSSSSNSSDCCSGSVSGDEEEDDNDEDDEGDGCLDDWEAVADALTVDDERDHPNSKPSSEMMNSVGSAPLASADMVCEVGVLKQECNGTGVKVAENCRAWRPDDAFRPQSLPNLTKQYSFPMKSERRCGGARGGIAWGCHSIISQPISCPICYEDLDLTDSSFMPCLCGFRLCLFCHKRILEADGRCPGCRKQYDSSENGINGGASQYRLARSYSMSTGS